MTWTPTVKQLTVLHQGANAFPYASEWVDTKVLAANAAGAYDLAAARTAMGLGAGVPLFVVYGADGPFWAHYHATATIPGASTTDGTSSQFSPNQEYLDGSISTVSLIASAATKVSMRFYKT